MTACTGVFWLFIISIKVLHKSFQTKLLMTIKQHLLHTDNTMPNADILPCCATNFKVKESNSNKWKGLFGKTHLGMKRFVKEKAATEEISQTGFCGFQPCCNKSTRCLFLVLLQRNLQNVDYECWLLLFYEAVKRNNHNFSHDS